MHNPAQRDGHEVRTVEHLLAALHGCGVHNARIEIDGPEVPILDGSARRSCAASWKPACRVGAPLRVLRVLRAVTVETARRAPRCARPMSFGCLSTSTFPTPHRGAIGQHGLHNGTFLRELSDCRTFCMRGDVEAMQANGLALGGTLENAVVFDQGHVLSPGGLRRDDEPVRHKMLDAMGDLYVLGCPFLATTKGCARGTP